MPKTLTHILYDTALTSASAAKTDKLFQHGEGSDTTHVSSFTNMVGDGAFPQTISMVVKRIEVFPEANVLHTELALIFNKAYLEFVLAEQSLLQIPLIMAAARHALVGQFHEVTADTDCACMAPTGPGFELAIPIAIPGGTHFEIDVAFPGATAAVEQLKVMLRGTLTRP